MDVETWKAIWQLVFIAASIAFYAIVVAVGVGRARHGHGDGGGQHRLEGRAAELRWVPRLPERIAGQLRAVR